MALLPRGAVVSALLCLSPPRPAAALRAATQAALLSPPAALAPGAAAEAAPGLPLASIARSRNRSKAHRAHHKGEHNASKVRRRLPDAEIDERWNVAECNSSKPLTFFKDFHLDPGYMGPPVAGTQIIKEALPMLDGNQWCAGTVTKATTDRRVALLLTGAAFRARNYFGDDKLDCTKASVRVQKKIARNHMQNVIEPIEALGMAVDVYLTIVPCSHQGGRDLSVPPVLPAVSNTSEFLVGWYGSSRVKGIIPLARRMKMYARMADSFIAVEEAMDGKEPYAYVIALRYDVALDFKVTDLMPKGAPEHRGLTFFSHGHDLFFAFPGEMWNCMRSFWDGCMRHTAFVGQDRHRDHPDLAWRRSIGCFDIGPLHIPEWVQGYAYDFPLELIRKAARWRGGQPAFGVKRSGTSAFTTDGREHRCHSKWFWPPTDTWEHTYMPYIYHLGLILDPTEPWWP